VGACVGAAAADMLQAALASYEQQRTCGVSCGSYQHHHTTTPSSPPHTKKQQEPIPTSLLKLAPENASRAVKMHAHIQRYCGDDGRDARLPQATAVEVVQKLLHQGLKRPELRDELYMQLVKQTRGNPLPHSRARAWELFTLVAAAMPPSKDFTGLISEYVHSVVRDGPAAISAAGGAPAPAPGDEAVRAAAEATWSALKRSTKAGPRRTVRTGGGGGGG